jgi:hypothetical protein
LHYILNAGWPGKDGQSGQIGKVGAKVYLFFIFCYENGIFWTVKPQILRNE